MKKTVCSFLLLASLFYLASCSKEIILKEFDSTTGENALNDNIHLEKDIRVLSSAIDTSNNRRVEIKKVGASSKALISGKELENEFDLFLVGQVPPPTFGTSQNLAASHVDLVGNFVYICYNTAGAQYAGTVDVIDISDQSNPVLASRLYFDDSDLHAVTYDSGYIYAAGSIDAEQSQVALSNAFVVKIPVMGGQIDISNGVEYGYQDGFVANDVMVNANGVFVTSGTNGYLTKFDKDDLSTTAESAYSDLRSLAETENGLAVLDGSFGVRLLNNSLAETSYIPIGSDIGQDAKRTISIMNNKIAVAKGSNGADIFNINSGQLESNLQITANPQGVANSDIVTNAVSFNKDLFFMANGGAGLSLFKNGASMELGGVLDLDGSINYVASIDDYIFAASGRHGLQIIKIERQGIPVTGVTLGSENELNISEGRTTVLRAIVSPADADNQSLIWSSSNESVATVDTNGIVTTVAEGTAFITATTAEGGFTDSTTVTVTPCAGDVVMFSDDFSSGLANWSAAKGTATTDSFSGGSYITNQDMDVIYRDFGENINGIVTLSFYDNSSDNTMQTMTRVDTGSTWYALGVNTNVSSANYAKRIGGTQTSTSVARTTGWHEFKWDYTSGTHVDMYIDGVKVATHSTITAFSEIAMGDWWGEGRVSNNYFDNVSVLIPSTTSVTGVTVDSDQTNLQVGDTTVLMAAVLPSDACNASVTWSSSNGNIATVAPNGLVTAIAAGNVTITATTNEGGYAETVNLSIAE